jgi:hypothetical protein
VCHGLRPWKSATGRASGIWNERICSDMGWVWPTAVERQRISRPIDRHTAAAENDY